MCLPERAADTAARCHKTADSSRARRVGKAVTPCPRTAVQWLGVTPHLSRASAAAALGFVEALRKRQRKREAGPVESLGAPLGCQKSLKPRNTLYT